MSPPSVDVRRAGARFVTRAEGLETFHCFSFGEHYDPADVGFGRLTVSNDERVLAGAGYPDHPHRDAEILTWVLSGTLVHEDTTGHRGTVARGLVQRLSAGAGVVHAERNDAYRLDPAVPAVPVHFVQMWLRPDEPGTPPAYAQAEVDLADVGRGWVPVASGRDPDAAVGLGVAGATLWVTTVAPGERRWLPEGARVHLYVAAGTVELAGGARLAAGDSVRVTGRAELALTGVQPAELLAWGLDA